MAAEVNNGSSTSGSKTKRGRLTRSVSARKTGTQVPVIEVNDDQVTCGMCSKVFVDENDKLMECERCSGWYCTECLGMSDIEYEVMGKRKDFHWFCNDCEKPAITAVLSDKQIEEKCAAYMQSMTGKIEKLEEKVDSKADKCEVEKLEDRVKQLEDKDTATPDVVPTQSETVRMTIEEQRERERRKNNIIIQNMPESKKKDFADKKSEDIESVKKIFSTIGVDEEEVVYLERIGQWDSKKIRTIKVTVSNREAWRRTLKSARKLKDDPDYENIFIGPDLTKMQQSEDYYLRKELKERRGLGEKDIFIRGGKIVHRQQRAMQFRGGATTDTATETTTETVGAAAADPDAAE